MYGHRDSYDIEQEQARKYAKIFAQEQEALKILEELAGLEGQLPVDEAKDS